MSAPKSDPTETPTETPAVETLVEVPAPAPVEVVKETKIKLTPELVAVAFKAFVQPGCTVCDGADNQAELTIASDVVRIYVKVPADQSHKTVYVKIPATVTLDLADAPVTE